MMGLWIAWVGSAGATSCVVMPDRVRLDTRRFSEGGVFSAWAFDHTTPLVEIMAKSYRLRGPDGELVPLQVSHLGKELRFHADAPLADGAYVIEGLGRYDEDGSVVGRGRSMDHTAWFALERVQAGVTTVDPAEIPSELVWGRSHAGWMEWGPEARLSVAAKAEAGRLVELEVEGVGPIARARASLNGAVGFDVGRGVCRRHSVSLPIAGEMSVRLVAIGDDGSRSPSDWTRLPPSVPYARDGSLGGVPVVPSQDANVSSMKSWISLDVEVVPGEVNDPVVGCGRLEAVGAPVRVDLGSGPPGSYKPEQPLSLRGDRLFLEEVDLGWSRWDQGSVRVDQVEANGGLVALLHDASRERADLLWVLDGKVQKHVELDVFHGTPVLESSQTGVEVQFGQVRGQVCRARFDRDLNALGDRECVRARSVDPQGASRVRVYRRLASKHGSLVVYGQPTRVAVEHEGVRSGPFYVTRDATIHGTAEGADVIWTTQDVPTRFEERQTFIWKQSLRCSGLIGVPDRWQTSD